MVSEKSRHTMLFTVAWTSVWVFVVLQVATLIMMMVGYISVDTGASAMIPLVFGLFCSGMVAYNEALKKE